MKTKSKTGRKQKHHVTSYSGETVVGLSRRPIDGRWRVIATGFTFTEADERQAVARFKAITGCISATEAVILRTDAPDRFGTEAAQHIKTIGAHLVYKDRDGKDFDGAALVDPADLWAYVRKEILSRPKWVAEQTGVEQIGYFQNLKPPTPLPSFKFLEQVWEDHCDASDEQRRKVLHDWRNFVAVSKVKDLSEITPQAAVEYRDKVYARGMSAISERNLFSRIRRLVSFAKSRALAMTECTAALEALSLLVPSGTVVSLNPMPIEPKEFTSLLNAATGDDRAMLLLMLNCAMYLQEVIRLRWTDLKDGCIITHRAKTGERVRVSVLWPETLEALAQVTRRGNEIFFAYNGAPLGIKGAEKRFRKLRTEGKVEQITSAQMRDGAYTAAIESGVAENLCRILAGHSCGISDHYVKRRPQIVAPACEAIHQKYLAPATKTIAA